MDHCSHSNGSVLPITTVLPTTTRRRFIGTASLLAAGSIAGCLSDDAEAPAAVALADSMQCDVCGMVISKHPGPDGQVFYEDRQPNGHENPARFDSLKQCLFPYHFERLARDWSASAVYVTDYSAVEYEVSTTGSDPVISSHPEAGAFADAETLQYVVGSGVQGAMGPDFVPFSETDDATEFAETYGGSVLSFDQIDEGVVGR